MPDSLIDVWFSDPAVDAQKLTDYTFGSFEVALSDFDLNQREKQSSEAFRRISIRSYAVNLSLHNLFSLVQVCWLQRQLADVPLHVVQFTVDV